MLLIIFSFIIILNNCIIISNSLNFWDSSHGDGSRAELLTMLIHLNQSVIVAGHKGGHSPHSHYFKSSSFSKAIINGGKLIYPSAHAPVVFSYQGYNQDVSEEDMIVAFDFYNKDKSIKQADVFICSNPTSFCELFMPLNRSIIWFPSHRYSIGRCSTSKWSRLSEHIIASVTPSKSRPLSVIAAMSLYDAQYINYYTGLVPLIIEPTGMLYGANEANYSQLREEILLGPSPHLNLATKNLHSLLNLAKEYNYTLKHPKSLYGKYKLSQLANHRAAILFPVSIHSHTVIELYALGIPLFVPTISFLLELSIDILHDRRQNSSDYCNAHIVPPKRHKNSIHKHDPETNNMDDIKYWLKFVNIYSWPHITIFDSFEDLFIKLNEINFQDIHNKMVIANKIRFDKSINQYKDIINSIDNGGRNRDMPHDYLTSIKELWQTERLQSVN